MDTDGFVTPKGRVRITATSTVDRTKPSKKIDDLSLDSHLSNSLGLLSLTNIDTSNLLEASGRRESIEQLLEQQRKLANHTLERATKVPSIPSKLLKPNQDITTECGSNFLIPSESTVSESDLQATPKNTSTPRTSAVDINLQECPTGRFRESIAHLTQMLESNASIHSVAEEFRKVTQNPSIDSGMFMPAEEAASKLLADELSWKQKHDIPLNSDNVSFQDIKYHPSMSIGDFFKQKCDDIVDLQSTCCKTSEPFALIDMSNTSNASLVKDADVSNKTLSISAIQQLLIKGDGTPNKVINYLLNQKGKIYKEPESPMGKISDEIFSLPVSRNNSYNSSFSDNEAIKVAVLADKENVKPQYEKRQQSQSVSTPTMQSNVLSPSDMKTMSPTSRSSSALTSLPNGKLPIESTRSELIWGCVKIDRCVTKEFLLRNKTPKTLRLQCSLSSYEFKIRKDNRSDSDFLSACKFVLHGHEARPFIVSYIPTKIGPAIDELSFTSLDSNLTQTKKQSVRLWGYGGIASVEYQNAVRDNTGKYWLSLGKMDNRMLLEQTFTIKNTGNLPSFTYLKLIPKHFLTLSNLKLEPDLFVSLPNEEKTIKLTYILSAKDGGILKRSLSALPVIDIGRVEVVFGSEVSRARLRRLCRKAVEKGLNVDTLSTILQEKIPGEIFPTDVNKFKESPSSIPDILETFINDEMVITLEQDPDQTLVVEYPEDSALFHSLCQEATILSNQSVLSHSSCRLEPPSVILVPPKKIEDSLFLISEASKTLHFEVNSCPNGLYITPTDGVLNPGQTVVFQIRLARKTTENYFKVCVYVENEVFEAEVKLLNVQQSNFFFE